MNTITLQINNDKAYKLIEDLEALNIVKVLKKSESPNKSKQAKLIKPSDYLGRISKKTAEKMMTDLEKSRDEWERIF